MIKGAIFRKGDDARRSCLFLFFGHHFPANKIASCVHICSSSTTLSDHLQLHTKVGKAIAMAAAIVGSLSVCFLSNLSLIFGFVADILDRKQKASKAYKKFVLTSLRIQLQAYFGNQNYMGTIYATKRSAHIQHSML